MNYRSLTYQRIRLKQRAVLSAHGRRFREGCLLRCALPESIQSNRQISSFPDIFLGTTPVLPFPQLMRHPPPDMDLDMILSIRESRQGLGGSLISYHGTKFRLLDAYGHVVGLARKDPVFVLTHMDGAINALYKGKCYSLAEFNSTPAIEDSASAAAQEPKAPRMPWKPPYDHPWKHASYERQQRIQQAREATQTKNRQNNSFPLAAP